MDTIDGRNPGNQLVGSLSVNYQFPDAQCMAYLPTFG